MGEVALPRSPQIRPELHHFGDCPQGFEERAMTSSARVTQIRRPPTAAILRRMSNRVLHPDGNDLFSAARKKMGRTGLSPDTKSGALQKWLRWGERYRAGQHRPREGLVSLPLGQPARASPAGAGEAVEQSSHPDGNDLFSAARKKMGRTGFEPVKA